MNLMFFKRQKEMSHAEAICEYYKAHKKEVISSMKTIVYNIEDYHKRTLKAKTADNASVRRRETSLAKDALKIATLEMSCLSIRIEKNTGVDIGFNKAYASNEEMLLTLADFIDKVFETEIDESVAI